MSESTPAAATDPDAPSSDWPSWAIYLGCSWTWCIGMFLPVLLVRDYGFWSFIAFAVPNVAGAAAMGWMVRSPAQSARFCEAHRRACGVFSIVTVLFQAYFVGWMSQRLDIGAAVQAPLFLTLLVVMLLLMRSLARAGRVLAIVVAAGSWFIFAAIASYRHQAGVPGLALTSGPPGDLAALAGVCALGFLLCPYLDLTFHHARQQLAPSAAKKAFAVGFGVVFASMILFTLLYADLISMRHLREIVLVGILLHMTVQCAFTAAAHLSVVPASRWIVLPIALAGLLALAGAWTRFDVLHFSGGEFVYRLFMAFYGLVAPAYVWIVGISSSQRATRRQWIVLAIVLLLATPFYWVAFIEKQMLWVLPGVAMVLISRLFDAGSIRHRSTA